VTFFAKKKKNRTALKHFHKSIKTLPQSNKTHTPASRPLCGGNVLGREVLSPGFATAPAGQIDRWMADFP
jgi:hypothetical protein